MLPALPVRSYAVYTEAKSILQGVAPAYLAAPLPAYLAGAVGCLSQLCSCLGAKSKPTKAPPSQPADEVWHAHPLNNNPGTTGCTLRAYGGSDPPVCVCGCVCAEQQTQNPMLRPSVRGSIRSSVASR
jgi:hypothetical protein